ncbi:MAG: VTT domain-containing protein [Candidatus Eisenbacteria bacterium]|nr:VTT domain-containing protein [Candidatus Eisenbacteria bacterium]
MPGLLMSFWSDLLKLAPPELSLPMLCLLLFIDNAMFAALTTPLLLAYAPHFEPWQVGVFGAASAGLGSTVQLRLFRWVLATDWPWVKKFAPSRDTIEKALAASPSASFLAIVIARATPIPDAPIKIVAAAGNYSLLRYFIAVLIGGIPYFALLAWLGHEFPIPPWVLLLVVLAVVLVFVFERWRKRGRAPQG